jgi:hypothetical protein
MNMHEYARMNTKRDNIDIYLQKYVVSISKKVKALIAQRGQETKLQQL